MPAEATGTIFIALRSTMPIQAMRNPPSSTAIRHASLNSSSRSRTRTISVLMPLSTAYTRLRQAIRSSASLRSVMSSPMLAVPITSPAPERSTELFQRMSRRSPERVRISFSGCHASGRSARSAAKTSFISLASGGMKSSNQSRPITSSRRQPVSRSR